MLDAAGCRVCSVNTATASIVFVEWLKLIRIQMSARARSKAGLSGQLVRARFSAEVVEVVQKQLPASVTSLSLFINADVFQQFEGRAG